MVKKIRWPDGFRCDAQLSSPRWRTHWLGEKQPLEVFFKKNVLKIHMKTHVLRSLFNKVYQKVYQLYQKDTSTSVFLWNLRNLRTPILKNICNWLLLLLVRRLRWGEPLTIVLTRRKAGHIFVGQPLQ